MWLFPTVGGARRDKDRASDWPTFLSGHVRGLSEDSLWVSVVLIVSIHWHPTYSSAMIEGPYFDRWGVDSNRRVGRKPFPSIRENNGPDSEV